MAEPRTAVLVADVPAERSLKHFADVALVLHGGRNEPKAFSLGVPGFDEAMHRLSSLVSGRSLFLHGDAEVLDLIVDGLERTGTPWSATDTADVIEAAGGSREDDIDSFLVTTDVTGRARELASLIEGVGSDVDPGAEPEVDSPAESEAFPASSEPGDPDGIEAYLRLLKVVFEDGVLDGNESEALARTAREHDVSDDDATALHDIFLRRVAVDAWADGRVTPQERGHLLSVARQLEVEEATAVTLLLSDDYSDIPLHRGDHVSFHGATAYPREEWDRRIASAGLVRTDLTNEVVCLVTAHGDMTGPSAAKAAELGVPVIDEITFSRILAGSSEDSRPVTPEDLPSAEPAADALRSMSAADVFPWLSEFDDVEHDSSHVAATWISYFGSAPLHTMSPVLDPTQLPDGIPASSPSVRRWLSVHTPVLGASADDLMALRGVGAVRRQAMVEAVVQEALDAPAPAAPTSTASMSADTFYDIDELDAYDLALNKIATVVRADDRYGAILSDRIAGDATLDELGQRFGVSRERVRQLEMKLRTALCCTEVSDIVSVTADDVENLTPLSELLEARPKLSTVIEGTDVPLWRVAEGTQDDSPEWTREGEWIVLDGVRAQIDDAVVDTVNMYGVAELPELAAKTDIGQDRLEAWLTEELGYVVRDEHVLTYNRKIGDRAAAELFLAGKPLTVDELVERIGDREPRSVANALAVDVLFTRCASDSWALAEWEMEEWTGIREHIMRRIGQSEDGGVSLDSLVEDAVTFRVNESSMRSYANGYEFQINDGIVSLRDGDVTSDALPEDTRNLYMRDGIWHLLVFVNKDSLRGSGMSVPVALTGLYGLRHGDSVELPGRLGPQTVAWKASNAQVSSYRRYLEDLGSREGDRVWLKFGEDFDVLPAPARLDGLEGADELLNLMGIELPGGADEEAEPSNTELPDGSAADPIDLINDALGLERGVARRKTVARLNHRDEIAMSELLRGL